jgi:hypothetical protein
MPKTHIRTSYTFDELTEAAQAKAVAVIAEKLAGDWWDDNDIANVASAILSTFAIQIGSPGEGESIEGVTLEGWSCGYLQSDGVVFVGHLSRENAPTLPWADGITGVTLRESNSRGFTRYEVEYTGGTRREIEAMGETVRAAIDGAHKAGYSYIEEHDSPEYAREWIDNNTPDFNEDGSLF